MKQHEAIGLALKLKLKPTAQVILIALVYKLDWETWEKPISVSYLYNATNGNISKSSISRALADLQKLGVIDRSITSERSDGVKMIKLNTDKLYDLCHFDIPCQIDTPCQIDIPCQNDIPPSVNLTYPPCQNDIPPMSNRHTPPVNLTDNIICNNQFNNLSNNQINNQFGDSSKVEEEQKTNWGQVWGTNRPTDPSIPLIQDQMRDRPETVQQRIERRKNYMINSYR